MHAAQVRVRSVLWALVTIVVVLGTAQAADRFVSTAGDDAANDCLGSSNPCRTIGNAITQAASGDVVKIVGGNGLYRENLRLDASTQLAFQGGYDAAFTEPPDPAAHPTVIDGRHRERVWTLYAGAGQSMDVTIDGVTLRRGLPRSNLSQLFCCIGKGGGLAAFAEDGGAIQLTVRRTTVSSSQSDDSAGGILLLGNGFGGGDGGTVTATLDRVTVTKNKAPYFSGVGIQSIGGTTASHVTVSIVNSVIAGNRVEYDGGGVGVSAYYTGSTSDVSVVNTTITGNRSLGRVPEYVEAVGGGGIAVASNDSPVTVSLTNVILWGNRARAGTGRDLHEETFGPAVPTVNADHVDLGDTALVSGTMNDLGGNVDIDPDLDPRFKLLAGSPLIDAGTCGGAPPSDFEGDPRPTGAGCDMGADEFVP